jgi:iron complex transport system substrate-binding protein
LLLSFFDAMPGKVDIFRCIIPYLFMLTNFLTLRMKRSVLVLLAIVFFSCGDRKEKLAATEVTDQRQEIKLKYAQIFKIFKSGSVTEIEVVKPYQGATTSYRYLLVPKGLPVPKHNAADRVIRTPVSSVVCTSTTHIPLLDYLDETDKLVGFPSTKFISSSRARTLIDNGKVEELGVDQGLNIEKLAVLKPELVVGYTMSADYGQFKKIEELGIPVILNSEYLESHPLGRAEWIKFMGLFFDRSKEADSVFEMIEKNYLETARIVKSVTHKPTVISGVLYGDAWFLPGGKNYASTILADAGCDYMYGSDSSSGYLELSFESVFEKAHKADLWIGVGTFKTLNEIYQADHRYGKFAAFKNRQVYSYDARIGSTGGNEYLELGYLRPDFILNDLVKISHPELKKDYELFFYRRLD